MKNLSRPDKKLCGVPILFLDLDLVPWTCTTHRLDSTSAEAKDDGSNRTHRGVRAQGLFVSDKPRSLLLETDPFKTCVQWVWSRGSFDAGQGCNCST